MLYIIQHFCQKARGKAHKGSGDLGGFLAILTGRGAAGARSCMNMQVLAGHGTFFPCSVGRGLDLCAKSRALRPGCAPKRACGRRPRRGRSPHGNVFGSCTRPRVFVGEAYMPPGRGAPSRGGSREIWPFALPHIIKIIFKMIGSAGVNARPTMRGKHHTNRQRAMPPLRIDQTRSQRKNRNVRQSLAGRMHAAPTNREKRHTNFKPRRAARGTSIFHFYFFIFHFFSPAPPPPRLRPGAGARGRAGRRAG